MAFVVTDSADQKLAYVYYEDESGRRSAAKLLSIGKYEAKNQIQSRLAEESAQTAPSKGAPRQDAKRRSALRLNNSD